MQSNIVWNVENQKKCQLKMLFKDEKLKMKISDQHQMLLVLKN